MKTKLSQPLDLPKMTLKLLSELILPEVKEASRKLEERREGAAPVVILLRICRLLISFNHFRFPCHKTCFFNPFLHASERFETFYAHDRSMFKIWSEKGFGMVVRDRNGM